jgi:hypothetical protein
MQIWGLLAFSPELGMFSTIVPAIKHFTHDVMRTSFMLFCFDRLFPRLSALKEFL